MTTHTFLAMVTPLMSPKSFPMREWHDALKTLSNERVVCGKSCYPCICTSFSRLGCL